MSDVPERTRKLIREREDGMCAVCRRPMTDIHHRQRKGMGGSRDPEIHDPVNLVGLCSFHHTGWAHPNPAKAVLCGLIVPTEVHPGQMPVWMQNVNYGFPGWFLLDNEYGVRWISDTNEPLHLPPGMPSLLSA